MICTDGKTVLAKENCQEFVTASYTEISFESGVTQMSYITPTNGLLVIGYNQWVNLGSKTILETDNGTMGNIALKKGTAIFIFRANTSVNAIIRFYPYS